MSDTTRPWSLLGTRQLGYFVTVVDERSFTAAAKKLLLSQPALSRQVRDLEQTVGGDLIERVPGGIQPTPAGRALLAEARIVLAAVGRAMMITRQTLNLEAGALELATLPTLAVGRLLPAIRRWHELYHEVPIQLREFSYRTALEEAVASGVGDLGIGTVPRLWKGSVEPLGWEEFVVVLPPRDPLLENEDPVELADLGNREWVTYDRRQGLSDLVVEACAQAGFRPRGAVETMQVEAAARFAAAGVGPALVPEQNVPTDLDWAVRRLARPIVWRTAAYTRGNWSPAASAFLEIAREGHGTAKPENGIELALW